MATGTKSAIVACSSLPEQQMNIYLKTIKTVAFKVKKSHTISDLKALYRDKEGTSEHLQEVFFSGEKLSDEQNLANCGIQENSIVDLYVENSELLKLFITIISKKKTVEIEARYKETVENVKSKVCFKEGIDLSNLFSLYFDGTQLDDSRTLLSIGMKGNSTLYLVSNPRDRIPLTILFPDENCFAKIEVKILFTVADLKAHLASTCRFLYEKETLSDNGKELEDSKTLAYYELNEDSVLTVEPHKIQLFVILLDGKRITLDADRTDTVSSLKEGISRELCSLVSSQKEGFSRELFSVPEYQALTFDGKRLEDNRELVSYGIKRLSTLHMV